MTKKTLGLVLLVLFYFPVPAATERPQDRVQFGQDIVIEANETAKDTVCIGCSIRIRGTVQGDAVAVGGSIEIEGSIDGDVVAVGGHIRLGPKARVREDVVSVGGRIERAEGAVIAGEIVTAPGGPSWLIGAGLRGLFLFFFLTTAVINLVLALLSYVIAGQQRVGVVAGAMREHAGQALLTGLGVLAGSVILFIIASKMGPVTPILALLVSLLLFGLLVLGYTGLSSWLGNSLARTAAPLLAVILGALLITLLQAIPFLGLLVFVAFSILALGSAALTGFGTAPDWLPGQFAARPVPPPPPLIE